MPKSWDKYAVHIIEPVLNLLPNRGELLAVKTLPLNSNEIRGVQVQWSSGIMAQFQTGGKFPIPLSIKVLGTNGVQELQFEDTFYAFRSALKRFIYIVNGEGINIPRAFTQEMVSILEAGIHA